jgi:hypothetical protein
MEGSALFRLKPDYSRPPLGEILSRTASLRPPPQAGKRAKTVRIWLRQWPTSPSSLFVENYPWKPTPLYLRALGISERSDSNDRKLVTVSSNYALLLRQTERRGEAKKLEAHARAISMTHRSEWGPFTVDVSDLLQSH